MLGFAITPAACALRPPPPWLRYRAPSGAVPSLVLDFAAGRHAIKVQVGHRARTFANSVAFTRASTARDWVAGALAGFAVDAPRLGSEPLTGLRRGLLTEGAATNLVLRSQEFGNAYWGREPAVPAPVPVADLAPDGSATAFRLVEAASSTRHWVGRSALPFIANGWHTVSVFARAATRSHIGVVIGESGGSFRRIGSIVNLTDGSVTPWNNGTVAEFIRHPPQALPGGWWRIAVSVRIDATATFGMVEVWPSSGAGVSTYLGNGASGVLVWGIQCEAGMAPTSYIPTASATVTRAADVATVPGAGWLQPAQGTIVWRGRLDAPSLGNLRLMTLNAGTAVSDRIRVAQNAAATGRLAATASVAGVDSPEVASTQTVAAGQAVAIAIRWGGGTLAICVNGETPVSAARALPPGLDRVWLGRSINGSPMYGGTVGRVTAFATALSDADLQALTA